MRNGLTEKIKELTKEVRLPGVRKYLAEEINQANLKNLTYEDFLYSLLLKEYDLRQESGKKNRIRLAGFPYRKYLEDLSVNDLPADAQKRLKVLKSLDFIEQGQNVILAGSPGTGNYRKYFFIERNEAIIHINQRIKPRFLLIILQLAAEVIQPLKQFCVIFPFGDILCYHIGITLFKNRTL